MLIDVESKVQTRLVGDRRVLQSNSLLAVVLNVLTLRGLYTMPLAENGATEIDKDHISSLLGDALAHLTPGNAVNSYTLEDALKFISSDESNCVRLNPHPNALFSFDDSPALSFLKFVDIPVVHGALADPAESYDVYSELELCQTWGNAMSKLGSSGALEDFIMALRTRPAGITPVLVNAICSLTNMPHIILYNVMTSEFHILMRSQREVFLFHAVPLDDGEVIVSESLQALGEPIVDNESMPPKATNRAFYDVHLQRVKANQVENKIVVDLSDREQIDRDFAIAMALQESVLRNDSWHPDQQSNLPVQGQDPSCASAAPPATNGSGTSASLAPSVPTLTQSNPVEKLTSKFKSIFSKKK